MLMGKNCKQLISAFASQASWLSLMLLAVCAGCGEPQGELFPELDPATVWPEPPEEPRIKYVGQLSTEDDLHRAVSGIEQLRQVFAGRGDVGVLVCPYALALDRGERLFVSDTGGSVIHMMDLATRRYQQFFQLTEDEKLAAPIGLAVAERTLYVADSELRKICVFDLDGNFRFSFGEDWLGKPSGIAYCSARQKLYVADTAHHAVLIFDAQGQRLGMIGSRGIDPGQFNFPTHLWTDQAGKLYVSDTLNYRIQVFTPEGEFLLMFGRQGDRPGYFAHPCGVATDTFGNIYVTDKQFENVQVFDSQGQMLLAVGGEGSGPGQFWLPAAILIDNANRIYIADSFNKRVQVLQLLKVNEP